MRGAHEQARHRYQAGDHGHRAGGRSIHRGDSYTHIFDLARAHGQDILSAALLPLAGDGVISHGVAVLLVASRQGRGIPLRARVLLLGRRSRPPQRPTSPTGCRSGPTGALLSIWPVVALPGLYGAADVDAGKHPAGQDPTASTVHPRIRLRRLPRSAWPASVGGAGGSLRPSCSRPPSGCSPPSRQAARSPDCARSGRDQRRPAQVADCAGALPGAPADGLTSGFRL